MKYLDRIESGLEHYKREFQVMPDGKIRAYSVNSFIDGTIKESMASKPDQWADLSCRKGCAHCCHNIVIATEDEADLLAFTMKDKGIEIDLDLLKRQAAFDGTDSQWFHQPKSENRCVFLSDENSCRVYESRPASCRKYYVVTPAEQCDDRVGSQQVAVVADVQAELAYSAHMDLDHDKVDYLPRVLLKRLGVENV